MNKFTSGLIAGGIVGAIGLTYAMGDRKTRKRVAKDSRKMLDKASDVMNNMNW